MILDFFVFWCLVVADCYTCPRLTFAAKAKGSSCSGEEHGVCWASIPLTSWSASCWHHLWDRKRPQTTPRLFHSPHTSAHIQAITVNGVLISQTEVSRGWNHAEKLTRLKAVFLATEELGGTFCVCDGAKLEQPGEGQLAGPADTKRMGEAGMGFQQKVASYLAEFFSWVTFWGVINPWAMHAQMGFVV